MINIDVAIDYMYGLRARNIRYSMDYSRTGADGTGDCSGTVYAALRKAGASDAGWVLNTDSMHDWLIKNGFRLIAHNKEWNAKRGDIAIFGEKSKSGGVAGHVVIFISNTQIIHCTWKSDAVNGVFVENEATACPYSMGWYVYRLDQQASTSQPKPNNQPQSKPATGIQWISEKWHFTTGTPIYLRTAPDVKSPEIALLGTGSYIKYDAYCYKDGYVWIRQPRGNGYGYLATGECVGNKRTSYWGSFD